MQFFGYEFKNEALLIEALTTPSFRMSNPKATDNQRLEFLGDSVLGFLAAERLYAEFPGLAEGELTVRRTHMVSTAALCAAAKRLDLKPHLRRNKGADREIPDNSKTLADAVEALTGAAYLDGGMDAARQIFKTLDLEMNAEAAAWSENPKGELQMKAQAMKPPRHPEYELLSVTGKSHEPCFSVRVSVEGIGIAEAKARTRREAETLAAQRLLTSWSRHEINAAMP